MRHGNELVFNAINKFVDFETCKTVLRNVADSNFESIDNIVRVGIQRHIEIVVYSCTAIRIVS